MSSTASESTTSLEQALERWVSEWDPDTTGYHVTFQRVLPINGQRLAVGVAVHENGVPARLALFCDAPGELLLHWGLAASGSQAWEFPPEAMQPEGSYAFDGEAARTPFTGEGPWQALHLKLETENERLPRGINLVLYDRQNDRWLKHHGRDLHIPVRSPRGPSGADLEALTEQISSAEVGDHSWTLMHRFDLCRELLDELGADEPGLALMLVWLRFSAMRQLPWQRKYNTKPRELAHAQDRLTARLAELYEPASDVGLLVRLMLATVGRGGEGQRVRDQILEIMHRQHIKERHGTWLEQWHQKLHNNTTPDDIIICRAYLAFLRSDGDVHAYDAALHESGIDRQRLASFERPITGDPEYHEGKRDALIGEMEHFLRLLKSVHSGEDLETSIDRAHDLLGHELAGDLKSLVGVGASDPDELRDLLERFTAARQEVHQRLQREAEPVAVRELLYVDLGLETQMRAAVEGQELHHADPVALIPLLDPILSNLLLTQNDPELALCQRYWRRLQEHQLHDPVVLRHALAAGERSGRALREATDRLHSLLQPRAEQLGKALRVESWTIPIFSEEVVRGTLLFVLGRVLRRLEPALRRQAGIGGWQIISPSHARGRLQIVEALRQVQAPSFNEPTIVLADEVHGDEEIPAGVQAVLTPDVPDLVSHVAVRARNADVLLGSCLEQGPLEELHEREGEWLQMSVSPAGDLSWERAEPGDAALQGSSKPQTVSLRQPSLKAGVVSLEAFDPANVGGKSYRLAALRDRLPAGTRLPPMAALRYGTFEAVLDDSANEQTAQAYRKLLEKLDDEPAATRAHLREALTRLTLPDWLMDELNRRALEAGLTLPADRRELAQAITRVWASQWTDRAYGSRRRLGLDHDDLHMAVLVQQLVPADYAFVLHTANPTTGDRDQLYGELVPGLGETLVGNYPGRPLAFTARKPDGPPELISLPSKSIGFFGDGIICRSDTNAEDLPGYAGAGLYESVPVPPAQRRRLDATAEPLLWDRDRQARLLAALTRLGAAVEEAAGAPQDIEGAIHNDAFYLLQTRPQVGLDNPL